MAQTAVFRYRDFSMEYLCWGSGPETILCLHGFGRTGADFQVFVPLLNDRQQLVALNLFGHGQSTWGDHRGDPITAEQWSGLVEAFIQHLGSQQVHLVGYSLGARMALAFMVRCPDRLLSVLLLAPDGLAIHPAYAFFARAGFGRWLSRQWLEKPGLPMTLLSASGKLGIIPRKVSHFVLAQLQTHERREQVYLTWTRLRLIHTRRKAWICLPETHGFGLRMVFGKYDQVIPSKLGKRINRMLGHSRYYLEVPVGHKLLDPMVARQLAESGAWCPKLK
ncbi:MAG: alpha/beta hydrolase [Flavobacteriales bacterium]|nr:alpha/beta hydrolase [Flavobacteriales bacterium]